MSDIESLKKEREAQWNTGRDQPRGWDRWRTSTFLEMIAAKLDRAIIAQDKINFAISDLGHEELEVIHSKLREDGIDSLKDASNYLRKHNRK